MSADSAQVHEYVQSLLDPGGASAVLDLGCGRGADLRRIGEIAPGATRLVGLDASTSSVAEARAAAGGDPRFSFIVHDAFTGLPFGNAEFDRVLSINLLECIPGKQSLLREIHRVLAPEEYEAFRRGVAELAGADRYFYSITMFAYVGRKR